MNYGVKILRPTEEDVTPRLSRELQELAARGWAKTLPHRTEEEIAHQFNTKVSQILKVTDIYKSFARVGGLVIATSIAKDAQNDVVGFALARNDVSGSFAERALKRLFVASKVYAWIKHVVVDGEFQGQHIGTILVHEALSGFRQNQIPTAYIFKENEEAINFFSRLGFYKSPANQEPKIINDYFGADATPVEQYRFAAKSVELVRRLSRQNS